MLSVFRLVGLLNAAIWLGGCVFFSFAAAPAIFQPEMKRLFQDYYTGIVAQMMQERYFSFQLVCGAIALAHTLVGWLWRQERSLVLPGVLAVLYGITLAGIVWFQPHLKSLFNAKYTAPSLVERQEAAASFRSWHGLSQGLNLVMLGGLIFYLWRTASPVPSNFSNPRRTSFRDLAKPGLGQGLW